MEVKELEKVLSDAYSIESIEGHGAEGRQVEYVGMVNRDGNRVYLIYKDEHGSFWYRTMFKTERGLITQYEYIFGKPEKKKPWLKRR